MGANTNPYLTRTESVVADLAIARQQLAVAAIKAGRAEKLEKQAKLLAETKAINVVGGDFKALGPNESAQNRAVAVALIADGDYQAAVANALDAFDAARQAEATMLGLQDEFRFLLAAIPAWATPEATLEEFVKG